MRIIRFIKKNLIVCIIIVLLLVVQAWGIVEIPELISKIVDVGIRNYGIEYATPIAIRESEVEKLSFFIKNKAVLENFNIEEINGRRVYKLKENVKKETINYVFARAITSVEAINRSSLITGLNLDIMPGILNKFNIEIR